MDMPRRQNSNEYNTIIGYKNFYISERSVLQQRFLQITNQAFSSF